MKGADLRECDLRQVILVDADLSGARMTGACVYGCSVWDVNLEGAEQTDLVITPPEQPAITVDNLEVAQFIYLLLNNKKLRGIIDSISSTVVLILGSFSSGRKEVLYAIKNALRSRNYSPVLFDFSPPRNRDLTETVSILAHLARFVIADITDPKSIPQELERIVPSLPSLPIQPILEASQREYGMFEHFRQYPWVLGLRTYSDLPDLIARAELMPQLDA